MSENKTNDLSFEINDTQFNFQVRLEGFNNILTFVEGELEFWKEFKDQKGFIAIHTQHWQDLQNQLNSLSQIQQNLSDSDFQNRWNNIAVNRTVQRQGR